MEVKASGTRCFVLFFKIKSSESESGAAPPAGSSVFNTQIWEQEQKSMQSKLISHQTTHNCIMRSNM